MVPSTTVTDGSLAVSRHTVLVERVETFEIDSKPIDIEVIEALDVNSDGHTTRWREYYDCRP
ncbi:hypothetical protein MMARJ_32280 [Mycobacterium marseillense]|jgi:hypothetical protein|uniref:Uncharacterized protein n=1 Tax=Mycobacterium marseillense TaxID=701042 RepID=A0ABM7JEV6_9MYCO|nr:hypothetical protein MMARJ_32280 [Mycobacterium marseillense]